MTEWAALASIRHKARLLRRSCSGWRDDEHAKAVAQMTTDELREVFAWFEATAGVGLGASLDEIEKWP